jgi:SAM-dependent methyltransferase
VLSRADQVTVIDASGLPPHPALAALGASMRGPTGDGSIAEPDAAFGLITCFGVLTYLPDPVASFAELRRCLAPGGWLLLREPIVAMNLEQPEHTGLGRHGRGIPLAVLDDLVRLGFTVQYRALCTVTLTRHLGPRPFNNPRAVRVDAMLSRTLAWNIHYRATWPWQRLRPKAAAYVLQRQLVSLPRVRPLAGSAWSVRAVMRGAWSLSRAVMSGRTRDRPDPVGVPHHTTHRPSGGIGQERPPACARKQAAKVPLDKRVRMA